jgi:hypothetical protein
LQNWSFAITSTAINQSTNPAAEPVPTGPAGYGCFGKVFVSGCIPRQTREYFLKRQLCNIGAKLVGKYIRIYLDIYNKLKVGLQNKGKVKLWRLLEIRTIFYQKIIW